VKDKKDNKYQEVQQEEIKNRRRWGTGRNN
jgi:hypothetical protein